MSDQLKLQGISVSSPTIQGILIKNGMGSKYERRPYEIYLALNEIEHRQTKVRHPQTNGFVERFHRTVLDAFFRPAFRTKLYDTVEALQDDLDTWLVHYNTERTHQGYRNLGKRAIQTIQAYLKSVQEET